MKKIKIYLAGPLFSIAEKKFNLLLAQSLESLLECEIILPQIEASRILGVPDFADQTFKYCIQQVEECDVVLALLEGADADSGTCIEIGYAYALHKPIIGVRTDFRASEDNGLNIMVSKICNELIWDSSFSSIEDLATKLAKSITELSD